MTDHLSPLTSQVPRAPQDPLTLSPSKGDDVASAWFDRLTMSGGGASRLCSPLAPALQQTGPRGAPLSIAGQRQ